MTAHFGKTKKRKTMKLSILTPTIPGREKQLKALNEKLAKQIGDLPVEHLILSDNRKRSIGEKRQSLVDIANGEYIAFCDDDDDVSDNYVAEILKAIETKADVITFNQKAFYNGLQSEVHFGITSIRSCTPTSTTRPRLRRPSFDFRHNLEKASSCPF